jgi:hypothetical protein
MESILLTKLQGARSRQIWEEKRQKRIKEALTWQSGTESEPLKHSIKILPSGSEVYFLKPGKEVFNAKRPNPNDMFPVVRSPEIRLKFDDIWTQLSKISVMNFDYFKAVLTLIYRNAYFIDHIEISQGIIRYEPQQKVLTLIETIQLENERRSSYGLLEILYFLDLLGWNEDMKYHVENKIPTFTGQFNYNVGRINTLLTCIRVPYQAAMFVTHCLNQVNDKKAIDFATLFTIMQQFAKSRGTCTPTQQQLLEWLSPYLYSTDAPTQQKNMSTFFPLGK